MTHYTTLIQRCRTSNSLLADEMEREFWRLERERDQDKIAVITRVQTMEEAKRSALNHAILAAEGNLSKAAKLLGIGRSTMHRMLKDQKESAS